MRLGKPLLDVIEHCYTGKSNIIWRTSGGWIELAAAFNWILFSLMFPKMISWTAPFLFLWWCSLFSFFCFLNIAKLVRSRHSLLGSTAEHTKWWIHWWKFEVFTVVYQAWTKERKWKDSTIGWKKPMSTRSSVPRTHLPILVQFDRSTFSWKRGSDTSVTFIKNIINQLKNNCNWFYSNEEILF